MNSTLNAPSQSNQTTGAGGAGTGGRFMCLKLIVANVALWVAWLIITVICFWKRLSVGPRVVAGVGAVSGFALASHLGYALASHLRYAFWGPRKGKYSANLGSTYLTLFFTTIGLPALYYRVWYPDMTRDVVVFSQDSVVSPSASPHTLLLTDQQHSTHLGPSSSNQSAGPSLFSLSHPLPKIRLDVPGPPRHGCKAQVLRRLASGSSRHA